MNETVLKSEVKISRNESVTLERALQLSILILDEKLFELPSKKSLYAKEIRASRELLQNLKEDLCQNQATVEIGKQ